MAELAFDIQGRGQRQLERQPGSAAGAWTIGRAFDSDVVLTDPLVDPQQARVFRQEDGTLAIEDLSSTNGTRLNGKAIVSATPFVSGDLVEVGHTLIRIFERDHAVRPTLRQSDGGWPRWLASAPVVLLTTLLGTLSLLGFDYLGFAGEYELQNTAREAFGFAVQLVAWTLFWGTATRILRGQFHFRAHWSIGALLIGLSPLLDELVALLAFNLQSLTAYKLLDALLTAAALLLALYATFTVATHWQTARRWFAAAAPTVLLLVSAYGIPLLSTKEAVAAPALLGLSRPPSLAFRGGVDTATFVDRQARLYDKVNELLEEED